MMYITLCKKCKSFKNGECTDEFEPGIRCACINYLEVSSNANRQLDNRCSDDSSIK